MFSEKVISLILEKCSTKGEKTLAEWKVDVSRYLKAEEHIECFADTKGLSAPSISMILRSTVVPKSYIIELPEEIIQSIFLALDDATLFRTARVCKEWLRSTADLFFRKALQRTKNYVDHDMAIAYYSKAISLDPLYFQAYLLRGKELLRKSERAMAMADLEMALSLHPTPLEGHLIRSIMFGIQGKFRASIEEVDTALESFPNEPMLYFERAFARHDLLDFEGTVADYEQCLKLPSSSTYLYPGPFLVYNNRAWAHELMTEWDAAIQDYTLSLGMNPRYVRALRGRSRVRSKTGRAADLQGAIADLFQAALLEPAESTSFDKYIQFRHDPAGGGGLPGLPDQPGDRVTTQQLKDMIARAKNNAAATHGMSEASKLYALAFVEQDLSMFADAIEHYSEAIALKYERPYLAFNNRGRCYHKSGDFDKAIEDYGRAIEATPAALQRTFLTALGNRCSALSVKGDLPAALADSSQMISLDKKNSYGYRLYASVLVDHKKRDEAIEFLGAGIANCPLDDSIHEMRGIFYYEKHDRDRAMVDLSNAIALNPKSYEAHNYRARARSAVGDIGGALADCAEMIRLEPRNHLGYTLYAAVLADHKRFDEAIAAATNAIKICPRNTYRNRAEIYSDQGRLSEAVSDYDEAIRVDPADVASYKQRAFARASLNHFDDAVADYTTSMRLAAGDVATLANLANVRAITGDVAGSIADYSQALVACPRDSDLLWNRAYLFIVAGQLPRAASDMGEVVRLKGDGASSEEVQMLQDLNRGQRPSSVPATAGRDLLPHLYFKYDPTFEKHLGKTKTPFPVAH